MARGVRETASFLTPLWPSRTGLLLFYYYWFTTIQTCYTRQSLVPTPPSDRSEDFHPAGALAPRADAVAAVAVHPSASPLSWLMLLVVHLLLLYLPH